MSNPKNVNEDDPTGQPTGERETVFQKLLRLQSDIEGQGHRVATAIKPIAEVLDRGGNVRLDMISHVKAQILLAHLQLDDLEQLLDTIE